MKRMKNGMWMMAFSSIMIACGGMDSGASSSNYSTETGGAYTEELSDYGYESSEVVADQSAESNGPTEQFEEDLSLDRKLIKNAYVSFETDSLDQRKRIVKQAIKKFDAYVEHEEQFMQYDRELVETTIRIPSLHFDDFLDQVTAGVGSFDSKTIAVDDVTEEFVDVEARIKTKKELKIRYIALLDRAETIAKIIELEREINNLQAEIESYEARLKYLSGSVKYATISLSYYRMLEIPAEFDNAFESAFKGGWEAIVWFCVGLVSVWPILLVGALIFLIVRLRLKSSKSKN